MMVIVFKLHHKLNLFGMNNILNQWDIFRNRFSLPGLASPVILKNRDSESVRGKTIFLSNCFFRNYITWLISITFVEKCIL